MAKTVLVIAEHIQGKLRQVSLECLTVAREVAGPEGRVLTATIGHGIDDVAQTVSDHPHDGRLLVDDAQLQHYTPDSYAAAIRTIVTEEKPDVIVFGHTAIGRDLAPRIAAELEAGQISDIVALHQDEDQLLFTRPIYAGKAFEQRRFTGEHCVITVRPNNFPPSVATDGIEVPVKKVALPPALASRFVVRESIPKGSTKRELTEANVVVSGGRGVKSADGFRPLEELADVLDGAVGASRAACDAGYCDYSLQIGQTGKVVTPNVYIACGISGAIQHLAGMSQSKLIVAINQDPEVPIFDIADYSVVGDLFDIVPSLTTALKRRQQT